MKLFLFSIVLGLGLTQSNSVISAEPNEILNYYCHDAGLEFQKTVQVGQGQRILINQGAFTQVQSLEAIDPSADFIKNQMIDIVGIRPECASFLMSKSTLIPSNSDDLVARMTFSFNSSELTSESRYLLDKLVELIGNSSTMVVEGNTDNIGSDRYNFNLGLKRSQSVISYLQAKGVNTESMQVTSFGESSPIANNDTSEGRQQNRRVEIK